MQEKRIRLKIVFSLFYFFWGKGCVWLGNISLFILCVCARGTVTIKVTTIYGDVRIHVIFVELLALFLRNVDPGG